MPGLDNLVRFIMKSEGADDVSKDIEKVGDWFNEVEKKSKSSWVKVAAAGTAIVWAMSIIGNKSVDMASEFNTSMASVSTLIDTNVEDMDEMKSAVLEIGNRTPVALSELSGALYDIRSAWVPASEAMATLEASAQLAVAWLWTTKEATNLLTSAINSFSSQWYDANEIANTLFATVKSGKTTVAEL